MGGCCFPSIRLWWWILQAICSEWSFATFPLKRAIMQLIAHLILILHQLRSIAVWVASLKWLRFGFCRQQASQAAEPFYRNRPFAHFQEKSCLFGCHLGQKTPQIISLMSVRKKHYAAEGGSCIHALFIEHVFRHLSAMVLLCLIIACIN